MISTLVGYAGGTTPSPTYQSIGDHSETVQIVFDPEIISYDELLKVFWESHDPTEQIYLTQYRNAVFYVGESQRLQAEASLAARLKKIGRSIGTAIEPAGHFTVAEDYHQKYYLRRLDKVMAELQRRYPEQQQLFRSTEAARLNGFLGCNGDPNNFGSELRAVGLSEGLERDLHNYLVTRCREFKGSGCALPPHP